MSEEDFTKNGDEVPVIEAETVDDVKPTKFACDKCDKEYKTQGPYEWHIKNCTGPKVKVERIPMTDEERLEKRRAHAKAWIEKNETISIRFLKDSDDLAFIQSQVELLQETDENAGMATYFKQLLAKAKKAAIKKGVWEKELVA